VVDLPAAADWPHDLFRFGTDVHPFAVTLPDDQDELMERQAADCAADLARSIAGRWIPYDGVPTEYIFHYEKDIIAQFASDIGHPDEEALRKGCPQKWPDVPRLEGIRHRTPLRLFGNEDGNPAVPLRQSEVGALRDPADRVLVDIRNMYHCRPESAGGTGDKPCCLVDKGLTFLEAGPREHLLFPRHGALRIGIVVSGGIAPGINAVIAGLVERHILYWKRQLRAAGIGAIPAISICGYRDGFAGLISGRMHQVTLRSEGADQPQNNENLAYVMQRANTGGSMFGTSRFNPLSDQRDLDQRRLALTTVLQRLSQDGIDILYVIGGDGSMKAAHALYSLNEELKHQTCGGEGRDVSIVGIPKTMDNDILWVWQSFGFMSAVEKATECLRLLHTEAISNPRLCVIQLFGSDSGFTVSHAALASLDCDAALIPEIPFTMDKLFEHIRDRLYGRLEADPMSQRESPFGMIVMAETAVPQDWFHYVRWSEYLKRRSCDAKKFLSGIKDTTLKGAIREELNQPENERLTLDLAQDEVDALIAFADGGRRVYGETPDPLRTVGLRLVSQVLQHRIRQDMGDVNPYWESYRVFTSEPRHLLRSSRPSANDIISGQRFGILAVDNAMAGFTDFMISQWLTEYVLVPLSLVVVGRKRVPEGGIFWKSVLAKTGQGDLGPAQVQGDEG